MVLLYIARVIQSSALSRNARLCTRLQPGFSSAIFWGFAGSPRDFIGSWLLAPFDHARHLKSRVPPPWELTASSRTCIHFLTQTPLRGWGSYAPWKSLKVLGILNRNSRPLKSLKIAVGTGKSSNFNFKNSLRRTAKEREQTQRPSG